jgi:hypothetical protein
MFQAFALICMLNGECAVVSDGIQLTDRSLCVKFHLATLTQDLSANPAFLRLASKSSFINFGCIDVSRIPDDELANQIIESLRSGHDSRRSAKPDAEKEDLAKAQRSY